MSSRIVIAPLAQRSVPPANETTILRDFENPGFYQYMNPFPWESLINALKKRKQFTRAVEDKLIPSVLACMYLDSRYRNMDSWRTMAWNNFLSKVYPISATLKLVNKKTLTISGVLLPVARHSFVQRCSSNVMIFDSLDLLLVRLK